MENIAPVVNDLTSLRSDVVQAGIRAYGAEKRYAIQLNKHFAGFKWYDVEKTDLSDAAKPVHAEKKELYKELNAVKHKNPSTVWARVRKLAKEDAEPVVEGEGAGEGEGESEGEGAGNSHREPITRNVQDLITLYKFNARQDSLPEQVRQAQQHIIKALEALKVNISMIK